MFRIYLPALVFILDVSSLDANGRTLAGKNSTIPSLIHQSNDTSVRACSSPYELIGNHCLFIDNDLVGSWEQIKTFCQAISGELVSLEDLNSLANIYTYVMTNGMNDVSYWTGANDMASEGQWIWSSNGSSVRMGMPAWGDDDSFNMYPSIDTRKNCAILNKDGYYFLEDTVCEVLHAAICEQAPFVAHKFESTISSANDKGVDGCVHPFQLIGNACLLIDTLNPDSYANKQSLCAELGGHMAKIVDANLLAAIYDFLILNDLVYLHLYIGATASDESGNWKWYDGTSVQLGTPFWGDGSIPQQPDNGYYPNFACLARHDHFYFHDVASGVQGGVICQYDP